MRDASRADGIQIQLIVGTSVVLIGIDVDAAHVDDLLFGGATE